MSLVTETVPLLNVRNVSKRFGGLRAVNDVSFEVRAGDILGVIGPNGAGKSTLLELLSGSQAPDTGEVVFRGKSLKGMPGYRVSRAGIARTFQKLRPFLGMTVIDNVMVGALVEERDLTKARELAEECLVFVGLSHKMEAMANTLSTGQRKRLELARVMAKRPALYLLDEVMAGVDQKSIGGLIDTIASLQDRGEAIIIIEHNLSVIRRLCSRLIAMHLGTKISEGLPADVLADETVVKAYIGD